MPDQCSFSSHNSADSSRKTCDSLRVDASCFCPKTLAIELQIKVFLLRASETLRCSFIHLFIRSFIQQLHKTRHSPGPGDAYVLVGEAVTSQSITK